MAFLKRFFWYLLGLGIGLIFLWWIVDKKTNGEGIDYCYLPNCRVLKDLKSAPVMQTSDSLILAELLSNGKVIFSESNTRQEPCKRYVIEKFDRKYTVERCPEGIQLLDTVN